MNVENAATLASSYIGDTISGVYVWGTELELGPFASTYTRTTTTSVTRNADVLSIPISDNIDSIKGALYVDFIPRHAVSGTVFILGSYIDASNYTGILHDGTNLIFRKRIGGTNYDATKALTYTKDSVYKVAISWGRKGMSIFLNGEDGTSHINDAPLQLSSTLQVGADGNSLQQLFGTIRNLRGWKEEVSNARLRQLTL
jgi:hypothetical protein